MRIWHYELIPYLPKSQLIAQWRELNSIYKKQDKHILINYIYNYEKEYLYNYSAMVIKEMSKRNIKIKNWTNFNKYFELIDRTEDYSNLMFSEHDKVYLTICYFNLREKCMRGQKDFDMLTFIKLDYFYKEYLGDNV